jgi:hypothetical protein
VRRLDARLTAISLANRSVADPLALAEALIAHAAGRAPDHSRDIGV